jgi:hypothetical protein
MASGTKFESDCVSSAPVLTHTHTDNPMSCFPAATALACLGKTLGILWALLRAGLGKPNRCSHVKLLRHKGECFDQPGGTPLLAVDQSHTRQSIRSSPSNASRPWNNLLEMTRSLS